MISTKYLIIGASAAGIGAANNLARLEPGCEILVIGAENAKPYNKCFLVDWLVGDKGDEQLELSLHSQVQILNNTKILELDVASHIALLSDGQQISYEKALLAIGVQPFVPNISGLSGADQVFNFHDLRDTQKIQNFITIRRPKQAVVIGAGLTGLECADALWRMGLQVTIIERGSQILGKLVDEAGAQFLTKQIQVCGVQIELNARIAQIKDKHILLESGLTLEADLIILAAGVRPNKLEIKGGKLEYAGNHIVVNSHLQTNLPNLWAAGDLIVVPDLLTGQLVPSCSWPDAMLQGNLAAASMAGAPKSLPGLLSVAKSRFFGQDFVSFGQIEEIWANNWLQKATNSYQRVALDQQGLVQGALLIGDITNYPDIRRAVLTRQVWGAVAP